MKLIKPLCKRCWFIESGFIPYPSKNFPLCKPFTISGADGEPDVNRRESVRDMLDRVLGEAEEANGYPVKIEIKPKKFSCLMEHREHLAKLHKIFFQKNYNRLEDRLSKETPKQILERNKIGYEEIRRLYLYNEILKNSRTDKVLLRRYKREKVKVRVILKEENLLDENVYLFFAPPTHLVPFSVDAFGAEPMPSFEFGYYKNRYLSGQETLVLLRKWSHDFRYFDTNLEFLKENLNVGIFRKKFSFLIKPVLTFIRKSKIIKEITETRGNDKNNLAQENHSKLRKDIAKEGSNLHKLCEKYRYSETFIKRIGRGVKKPKGFYRRII